MLASFEKKKSFAEKQTPTLIIYGRNFFVYFKIFEGQNGCAAVRTAFGGVISTMMSTLTSMQEGEYDSIASGPTVRALFS